MKFLLLFVFILIIEISPVLCVENYKMLDAASLATGGASVATINGWSCLNNQGALAFAQNSFVGAAYESRFSLKELASKSLVVVYPSNVGVFSGQFMFFGGPLFSTSKLGVGYSRLFGPRVGAGFHFDLLSVKMNPTEPPIYIATCELGMLAKVSDKTNIGFHLFNPTAVQYDLLYMRERMPVEYRLGINYSLSHKVSLSTELVGEGSRSPVGRWGVEYELANRLYVRGGFQSFQASLGGGFAYVSKSFGVDFSIISVRDVGRIYGISLSLDLK